MILWNYNNKVKCYYGIILRLYMSFAMHKIVLTYTVAIASYLPYKKSQLLINIVNCR